MTNSYPDIKNFVDFNIKHLVQFMDFTLTLVSEILPSPTSIRCSTEHLYVCYAFTNIKSSIWSEILVDSEPPLPLASGDYSRADIGNHAVSDSNFLINYSDSDTTTLVCTSAEWC